MPSKHEVFLKAVRARVTHSCARCGTLISTHELYYREDRFLQFLHSRPRSFCQKCFETYGDKLLGWKESRRDNGNRKMEEFSTCV